ncbi:MAG: hypothetical protein COS84_08310 [Armatimonadetes bacterium CG07_land_8_20_14_0_80_40_9]|nr:MAG: hypothetical protein COS84_08310 [Armatimonadetes bacterium CG07_land_8_20_14_0_80_40_9]
MGRIYGKEAKMGQFILGVGLSTVDLIAEIPQFPKENEATFMQSYDKQVGGPVSNALVTLSRLGIDTVWVGRLGDDEYGEFILKDMRKEGVNINDVVVEKKGSSPFSFILVSGQKKRTIIFNPGLSFSLDGEVPEELIKGCDLLHLDGFFIDGALSAAKKFKDLGKKVSLDAGAILPGLDELLPYVDLLIPSIDTAKGLTGRDDYEEMLNLLSKKGPQCVVITLGEEGSIGMEKGEVIKKDAFKVNVVDTTGAGDSFHGAFVYGELQGWDLKRKLTFSNALSALKCTKMGGRRGLPKLEEVNRFLRERGMVT